MAEINKRNLVDETAATYAANTTASNPAPLFSTGMPAKIIRASIANTNLLSKDGDLFVGTGSTYTETIDGTEYTYAKIAKKNQSELFVNDLNSAATNVGLAASVGKSIDDRLYLTSSSSTTDAIGIGNGADAGGHSSVALGASATVSSAGTASVAIGNGAHVTAYTAIQLGIGTNETANSFQVSTHQMLDLSTGKIPLERINQSRQTSLVLGSNQGEGGSIYGNTVYGIGAKIPTVNSDATVIGHSAEASSWGVAVGAEAYCKGTKNVVIGYRAILGVKDGDIGIDNCIAIGAEAKIENSNFIKNTAIQLGTGTNSAGGFQVWDYQLMDENGIIPSERRPIYKCTVRYPNSYSPPTSSTSSSVNLYYLSWYSSTPTIPTDFFIATGYRETISSDSGSNTKSTYSPCCGKIRQRNNGTISLSIFNIYGTEVTGIDESNIVSHFELI